MRTPRPLSMVLLLVASLALARCSCFVPVPELLPSDPRDGGLDAGNAGVDSGADAGDAGADAGTPDSGVRDAGHGCTSSSDCPRQDAGFPFCAALHASCVAGRCVQECVPTARTCTVADAGVPCATCTDPPGTRCVICPRARRCVMQPSPNACPGRIGALQEFLVDASGPCGGPITPADGGAVAGTWYDLGMEGLVWFPELGGWCTARSLYTGAPRALLSCPACSFVEMGCE